MTNYQSRHGEAVAIGMALDLVYAQLVGLIDADTLKRILEVLERIGFSLHIPLAGEKEVDELLRGIEEFREHLGGELTITLIDQIGTKHDVHQIDRSIMKQAIIWLNNKYEPKISVAKC